MIPKVPIIADMFYRTGLIERWGRGTNRVIEMCRATDIPPPVFEQIGLGAVVTFRVNVSGTPVRSTSSRHQVTPQVTPQVTAILEAARQPSSREELQVAAAIKDREHFRKTYLLPLIDAGWLERTLPDKPSSRLQKYRITSAGIAAMQREQEE